MNWKEYIDFVDIGGLTDSTYHNVRFKKYGIVKKGHELFIRPELDFGFIQVDVPTAKSARDLLIDLLCLYNKITTLDSSEINSAILDWCKYNVHPYNTEALNNLFQSDTEEIIAQDVVKMATFSIDTFKKDLIALGTHYGFFYALEMLNYGDRTEAMNLYKKYEGWSEYSCFEKYKKKAIQESDGDTKAEAALFKKFTSENHSEFMKILVNKFHTFKLSLIIDPVTMKPAHHVAVDSAFDIAWFAFSKMITEDASYIALEDENYFDDFNFEDEVTNKTLQITRCPICGDYIKKIKNKKYCNKPECQRQRNALKSREYSMRKKLKEK